MIRKIVIKTFPKKRSSLMTIRPISTVNFLNWLGLGSSIRLRISYHHTIIFELSASIYDIMEVLRLFYD